jgi:hypothetical protein
MAAPDFYFAVNAIFRHLHDRFGKEALVRYWRELGRDHYRARWMKWSDAKSIADDWLNYFNNEPGAVVEVSHDADKVELNVLVCPAIKHLLDSNREIVPYFCEHCDHICASMAQNAGYNFTRTGGMGSCHQTFLRVPARRESPRKEPT